MNYIIGFLEASPVLKREIASITQTEITLRNGIVIASHANSYRSIRGRTLIACIFDEVAAWRDESSAVPDKEVFTAVLPSLITTGGLLVGISTGYRRTGLLYEKHRDGFGVDGDTLVVQGGTTAFNATISEDDIAAQRAADPEAASAEWDGEFRNDLSGFLSDDLIDRAVEHGRPLELPPRRGLRYSAFCDASGGRHDAYAICIAHKDGDCAVVDVVRGVHAPFDPQSVTEEYAKLVKEYGVTAVEGDNYSAEWVASAWSKCGIRYTRSEINKSAIYLETLPLWTRNLIRLPDHPRLLRELRLLERRTHRSGRDSVDHGPRGSDDFANSTCGALHRLASPKPKMFVGTYSQAATGMGVGPPVLPLQAPYNAPEQNACTPGKGINSRPWLDAAAVNFNQRYGLRRPR